WIDFALLNALQQRRQIVLDRCLSHTERQASVDRRPHWDLVDEPAIDTDNGNGSEVATAMNCLTQYVRSVRPHECRDLHAIDNGIRARESVGLGADRVDAGIGASTVG